MDYSLMDNCIGFVCARADSKRLENKNKRLIGSETLAGRACRILKQAELDRVYCVSDIPEKELRLSGNAKYLERPKKVTKDNTPLQETVKWAVNKLQVWHEYKNIAIIMANCPFMNSPLVKNAIQQMDDRDQQIVRSFNYFGVENGLIVAKMDYYMTHEIDTYSGAIITFGWEIHDIEDYAKAVEALIASRRAR